MFGFVVCGLSIELLPIYNFLQSVRAIKASKAASEPVALVFRHIIGRILVGRS